MAVDESYVYLLLKNNSLIAIDISDPARPTEIARIDSEEGVFLFSVTVPQYRRALPVPNFAFEWPYIYYTDTIGLHVFDVRDRSHPVEIELSWMRDGSFENAVFCVRNRKMLVSTRTGETIRVRSIDMKDLSSPLELGSMEIVKQNGLLNLEWGNDAYACAMLYNERYRTPMGEELLLIDTQSTESPRLITSYPMSGIKLLNPIGNTLYVVLYKENARNFNRVQKIDLRDPLNPVFGESVQLDYYIHEIDAFKNYLLSFVYDKRPYFSLFHPQGNFLLRDCYIPAPEDLTLYQIKDNYLIGVVMTMDGYRLEINEIVLPSMIRHFMNFQ